VPDIEAIEPWFAESYMVEDQRFAARRPDVLSYQTDALHEDITFAGELLADLWVSTSGTDSDWVVKVIDVFPPNAPDFPKMPPGRHMGGYQMMVRSEVIRGRFRNSDEHPEAFVPDQPTRVKIVLQDLLHTFKKEHRIMVQVQSSWFPMVDRNPQRYVDNIYLHAEEKDFIKANQRVFRSTKHPSSLQVGILRTGGH
jgi:predicted acyl esterase